MKNGIVKVELGDRDLVFESGRLANFSNGAVLARYGETVVLATAVMGSERPDLGYFPLTVHYEERLYAGGVIKGSRWVKREGRPSDEAILSARLIDRSIRPLFPKGFSREIQVIVTVLSVDGENDPDVLAVCAASCALAVSDIPWMGPCGAVRVGFGEERERSYILNPVNGEREDNRLDLVVSAVEEAVLMVEAGASEVEEEEVISALDFGHKGAKKVIKAIEGLQEKVGKEKVEYEKKELDKKLVKKIEDYAKGRIESLISQEAVKEEEGESLDELKEEVGKEFEESEASKKEVFEVVDHLAKKLTRKKILEKGVRPDGRKAEDIREIEIEVGLLPRTHGSALFGRGQTQALTIVTLGTPSLEQFIESAEGEERKRFIHHYNMPPYSVGETGRMGWPSRREVGHGALAERALLPVIPGKDKFPYTIRIVSEIMASNGSTSMASVCGSSLALMDAGASISAPVAGIAMGLITDAKEGKEKVKDEDYVILSDILGFEDFFGDMDFKVAGTEKGITALQLDVKIRGLTLDIFKKAFDRAKEGRLFILGKMREVLEKPRERVSKHAPKIKVLHVSLDKIGDVIGPGGRIIRRIISETGAEIGVEDDGEVVISAEDEESLKKATEWVRGLTMEFSPGDEFIGEVKRIEPYGVFVEVVPGKEGLVHVSEMSTGFVSDPKKLVKEGEKVRVKLMKVDDLGRLNLTMVMDEKERQRETRRRVKKKRFRR